MNNNAEYWEMHAPDDAPPYSDEMEQHVPMLLGMTTWKEYMDTTGATEALAEELASPTTVPASEYNDPDAELIWRSMTYDDAVLRVYKLFVRNITHVKQAPELSKDDNLDFLWSTHTVLIAAAGYPHWRELATIASNQLGFPYTGDESEAEFQNLVREAVSNSKIPVSALHMSYHQALQITEQGEYESHILRRAITMLHILKHCLLSPEGDKVVVVYRGSSTTHSLREVGENLWNCTGRAGAIGRQLAIPSNNTKKEKNPWSVAGEYLLTKLTPKNLVRQRSPVQLPPSALYGPWTSLVPTNSGVGFFQHGVQLTGAWMATAGKVTPNTGDAEDALHTAWDVADPHSDDNLRAKKDFENSLPAEYTPESPFTLFYNAFPNLDLGKLELDYARLLFDLPIYAELLRPYVSSLRREYPPVMFLPEDPTPETSTNQGKSMATQCLASVVCPGIKLIRTPDTTSAPDLRAIADVIRTHGTAALDEWRQPRTETHYFSHDNFQSLVTGGEVTSGRAYENSGSIRLSHSPVISTKWCDFPDDMVNRCMFLFLGEITKSQRSNSGMLEAVRSGRVSLLMRLGAWADIEENGIVELLLQEPKASGALRYEGIEALARVLCRLRGLDYKEYCRSVELMRRRFIQHVHSGIDAGMNKMYANSVTFGLSDLFAVGEDRLREMCSYMHEPRRGGWGYASSLLKALLHMEGKGENAPFSSLVTVLGDEIKNMTNRKICMAVTKLIKTRLRENEYKMLPDLRLAYVGWAVVRGPDRDSAPQFRLINTQDEPDWREKYGVTMAK